MKKCNGTSIIAPMNGITYTPVGLIFLAISYPVGKNPRFNMKKNNPYTSLDTNWLIQTIPIINNIIIHMIIIIYIIFSPLPTFW